MSGCRTHPLGRLLFLPLLISSAAAHIAVDARELLVPEQYPSIHSAVAAAEPGDTVLVSEGTYFEFVRIDTPLTLVSRSGPELTVIDWDYHSPDVPTVSISADNVRLSGFTVTGGYGNRGGGIAVGGSSGVVIENCWVMDNFGHEYGGGIAITRSDAIVRNNRIIDNDAGVGGGITVIGPTPNTVVIEDNIVEDNWNGGMRFVDASNVRIVRNVVRGNHYRPALAFYDTGGLVVADNLIVENESLQGAGGISWYSSGQVASSLWVNNTVADNQGADGVDQVHIYGDTTGNVLANNIVAGATALRCQGRPTFRYNNFFGAAAGRCAGTATRGTNMTVNPEFIEGSRHGHPYHLASDSPLIDAGSNRHAKDARVNRDLGGRPRIIDGGHGPRVDIGVFEYKPR